jgi:hypothetical protein
MPVDHIRYDILTQDALRSVIRVVLADVAAKGLPGDHHFYITFDTRVDGVRLSARLKAAYPEEMTIVLQHQFWDLAVGNEDFDVGLAFNGIPERLHVPFRAVKAFMDPSVQFGLQFAVDHEGEKTPRAEGADHSPSPAAERPAPIAMKQTANAAPDDEAGEDPSAPPREEGSAEVVRLDRFRKK